jgi:predicted nucleotidyltransferase
MVIENPRLKIDLPMDEIAAFCRRWQIAELAVFGSVLRDDFRPDSDVDFLVTFAPDAPWTLFDFGTMQQELESLVGRQVDLVEKVSVEKSHNWIRRREILQNADLIYVSG